MNLYEPLYIPRPTVEPELFASLRPPVYESAMDARGTGEKGVDSARRLPAAKQKDAKAEMRDESGHGQGRRQRGQRHLPGARL